MQGKHIEKKFNPPVVIDLTEETPLLPEPSVRLGKRKRESFETTTTQTTTTASHFSLPDDDASSDLPEMPTKKAKTHSARNRKKTKTHEASELETAFAEKEIQKIKAVLASYATQAVSQSAFIFQNAKKTTCLHEGVALKDISILKTLMQFSVVKLLLNQGDKFGETPLHRAVKDQKIELVEFLLEQGANVKQLTSHQKTALHYAADKKNVALVNLLIAHGAGSSCQQYDHWDKLPIHSVLKLDRENCGRGFVKLPSILAICEGFLPHLTKEQIVKIDQYGKNLFHYAVQILPRKYIEALLKHADISALSIPDQYGKTTLHIGAKWGNTEVITFILAKTEKTLVNQTDRYGKTPLHEAAIYCSIDGVKMESNINAIKMLLAEGATFETKSASADLSAFEEVSNKLGIVEAFEIFSPYMKVTEEEKQVQLTALLENTCEKQSQPLRKSFFAPLSFGKRTWNEVQEGKDSVSQMAKKSRFFKEEPTATPSIENSHFFEKSERKTNLPNHFQYDLQQNKVIQECTILPSQCRNTDHYWLFATNHREPDADSNKVGKWMLFYPTHQIDAAWETIKAGIRNGNLWNAKVSTVNGESNKHAIIVYTKDYTNLADVARVHDYLKSANLVKELIYYKTDNQTRAGIYSGTSTQRSWIYTSKTIDDFRDSLAEQNPEEESFYLTF